MYEVETPEEKIKQRKLYFTGVSIVLFIISMFQHTFYVNGENYSSSIWLIVMGWAAFFIKSSICFSWLANPLIIGAWFYMIKSKTKLSCILSVLASISALSFLLFKGREIQIDETGNYGVIEDFGAGYWTWLFGIIVFTIGTFIILFMESKLIDKKE